MENSSGYAVFEEIFDKEDVLVPGKVEKVFWPKYDPEGSHYSAPFWGTLAKLLEIRMENKLNQHTANWEFMRKFMVIK